MSIATDIQAELTPILPGYTFQFGKWLDSQDAAERFAVIQPVGGNRPDIVRYIQYRIMLIGQQGEGELLINDMAESVIDHLLTSVSFGELDYVVPSEPVFWATSEDRPVFEVPLTIYKSIN